MTTEEFIQLHRTDDVRDLALRTPPQGVDLHESLVQISGWQKSRTKLPLWAETQGILFPQHLSMEQCSSQLTAEYKLSIVRRLCMHGGKMADLTAGFGVDATILGRHFSHVTLVEQNPELCRILSHNLPLLGINDFTVYIADTTQLIPASNVAPASSEDSSATVPFASSDGFHSFDFIFLDPARRDVNGRKTVLISDCTPDVCTLQEQLFLMSPFIMVKLSPMLDLTSVRRSLSNLTELHIVSVNNECKEILAVMQTKAQTSSEPQEKSSVPTVYCVNITPRSTDIFVESASPSVSSEPDVSGISCMTEEHSMMLHGESVSPVYLYEPNSSIMKAGIHDALIQTFQIEKVHPNSHLYLSRQFIGNFPGRKFKVLETIQLNKSGIRRLKQLHQANITVRNYPMSADQLRRRLQLRDGGPVYLFATTAFQDRHVVYMCEKCD